MSTTNDTKVPLYIFKEGDINAEAAVKAVVKALPYTHDYVKLSFYEFKAFTDPKRVIQLSGS